MLVVPDKLNRNAKNVQEFGPPEETGRLLINYLCQRIGVENLEGKDVLDFGCGVRFSQSIINLGIPIGQYFGLDVNQEVIDFLTENVKDSRFSYLRVNTRNQFYNKDGIPLDVTNPSPLGEFNFDIACMFSVVTHLNPKEVVPVFNFLREHIRPGGHLFFSAFIHDEEVEFKELNPTKPGAGSSYNAPYLTLLLESCGWQVVSVADRNPNGLPILTSFLCVPDEMPDTPI